MRTFDFSPLYKSTIGFDHITAMLENVNKNESQSTYPPYNIELTGTDQYKITMALAGFKEDELRIQSEQQTLSVIGEKEDIPTNKNLGMPSRPLFSSDCRKCEAKQWRFLACYVSFYLITKATQSSQAVTL